MSEDTAGLLSPEPKVLLLVDGSSNLFDWKIHAERGHVPPLSRCHCCHQIDPESMEPDYNTVVTLVRLPNA